MLRNPNRHRGVTLVELLVALAIMAVLSTAVAVLLAGAGHTHQYINTETTAMADVENAYRRILHNIRTASALTNPTNTTATNTLTISTQPDPAYSNLPATVTYAITNGDLTETDSRYGNTPTVIVSGISTFSVQRITTTSPTQIAITLISNTTPAVKRTATISCRNF